MSSLGTQSVPAAVEPCSAHWGGFGCGVKPWRSSPAHATQTPPSCVVPGVQRYLGLAAAPALLPQPTPRHSHQPCWSWPCSMRWPCCEAGRGVCVCGWQGDTDPRCHHRDGSGSRWDGAARVPSAIANSSCSGHVFAFACLIFWTPFATFPALSLHFSLLFPVLPLFFCFFSFCSSCLSRAAARGDGVVGSSGRWAACRGAFGSSPGSRQARGVRAGT